MSQAMPDKADSLLEGKLCLSHRFGLISLLLYLLETNPVVWKVMHCNLTLLCFLALSRDQLGNIADFLRPCALHRFVLTFSVAFDNQKQDGNESSSWKSYAVTAHSCVAQGPYQTISDIADGLSEGKLSSFVLILSDYFHNTVVSKNQKQDGNLFTESNAATIKQVQLQVYTCVCAFVRIHLVHSLSTHKGKGASGSFCPNLSSSIGAPPTKSTGNSAI